MKRRLPVSIDLAESGSRRIVDIGPRGIAEYAGRFGQVRTSVDPIYPHLCPDVKMKIKQLARKHELDEIYVSIYDTTTRVDITARGECAKLSKFCGDLTEDNLIGNDDGLLYGAWAVIAALAVVMILSLAGCVQEREGPLPQGLPGCVMACQRACNNIYDSSDRRDCTTRCVEEVVKVPACRELPKEAPQKVEAEFVPTPPVMGN